MTFTPLASSSRGNAYLLRSEGAAPLLLEAGIPIKRLRERLWSHGVSLSDLTGCLLSHEHLDHSEAIDHLLRAGVDCYMSKGTAEIMGWDGHHRTHILEPYRAVIIGGWNVMPFPLEHDAAEPLGVLIAQGTDHLLFIPDTQLIKNRFVGVNILVIETNHAADIMSGNVVKGKVPEFLAHRIRRNHLGLQVVKDFIVANEMQKTLREVHLIHLSDTNSDEERFIRELQELIGIPVYACGE